MVFMGIYFKYFTDAKQYGEKHFAKYRIDYCQEHKKFYVWWSMI